MKVIGSCSWTWGVAPERVMMTRVYLPITTVQSHSSLYQGAVQNSPFCFCFCLFVVIKPENLYFASRLGLKVNPLWFYPLKYYWQHVPGKMRFEMLIEMQSKTSMVEVQVSFQMSHCLKTDLWWPSRNSFCIPMTISNLIFSGTGCSVALPAVLSKVHHHPEPLSTYQLSHD